MGARAPWALRHELPRESDEKLTDRAREGDQSAFGELYRRHRKAAESTAWCFLRSKNDADDVVADAFAGVLSALRNGHGPRDNFRRYLLACVRNGCRARRSRSVPLQEPSIEHLAPVLEGPEHYVEANTVARAFASLTPRWQHTLWLTEVEQRSADEVSERMHLSPTATAALAYRARQAFATAYLAEHVVTVSSRDCVRHAPQLAAYVRGSLTGGSQAILEHHLVTCRDCAVAAAELRDLNASLRSIALPGPLLAAGAVTAAGSVTPATVATVGVTGSAATATTGVWASSLPGAVTLVKGLVAILLVAPAITAERPDVTAMGGTSGLWVGRVEPQPDPIVAEAFEAVPKAHVPSGLDMVVRAAPSAPARPRVEAVALPVVEPVREPAVEPVVQGLDDALAMMGLGSTGETVRLLRTLVPLLDGPLVNIALNDLLGVEAPDGADPTALTNPVLPMTRPAIAIAPLTPPASLPVVATPPGGALEIALPAVVLPAITLPAIVDRPLVPILDIAIIDHPPAELLAVERPAVEPLPLDLPGVSIPPLNVPSQSH